MTMSESHRDLDKDNTELMLRMMTWSVRTVGLAAVGFAVLTNHEPDNHFNLEVTALVAALFIMAWWAFVDRSLASRERSLRLLPTALAIITITSGVASVTHGGGPLIFLGFMATTSAGGELDMTACWTIAGLGVLAVECACLATSSSTWTAFGYPLIILVGLLIGRNRRAYQLQAEQSALLLSKGEELREEQNRTATLDERNRIAREIHDVLAHSLGALGVQIQAARAVLTDQGHPAHRRTSRPSSTSRLRRPRRDASRRTRAAQ
jgi:signal transduction histidine kinase